MGKHSKEQDRESSKDHKKSHKVSKHKKDKKDKKERKKEKKDRKYSSDESDSNSLIDDKYPKISEDDYFTKSEEFRIWLKLAKSINFEDLTSKEARKLFIKDFSRSYNRGKLNDMYYTGDFPLSIRDTAVKTQHKWGFKLSTKEKDQLNDLAEDVDIKTRQTPVFENSNKNPIIKSHHMKNDRNRDNISKGDKELEKDNERDRKKIQHYEQKSKSRSTNSMLMDELLPGGKSELSGRERNIDKKRSVGDKLHGAAKDREDDRDGLNMNETNLMGGDQRDDFYSMLERKKQQQERFHQKKNDRASELLQKEKEREQEFMAKLGINPSQGRIMIRPRNDN